MGNILTNSKGNINNNLSSSQDGSYTSFAKTINDTLLELDLYNLDPNLIDPGTGAPGAPRTQFEIDYTSSGYSSRPTGPGNAPGTTSLIDINGIPYSESNDLQAVLNQNTTFETVTSVNDEKYWKNISKFYNFKRGVCNATQDVPVNTAGVLLPKDQATKNKLKSCLINGTTNGPTSSKTQVSNTQQVPIYKPDTAINPSLNTAWYILQSQINSILDTSFLPTSLPTYTPSSGPAYNSFGSSPTLANLYETLGTRLLYLKYVDRVYIPVQYGNDTKCNFNTPAASGKTDVTVNLQPLIFNSFGVNDSLIWINFENLNITDINKQILQELQAKPDCIGFYAINNPNYYLNPKNPNNSIQYFTSKKPTNCAWSYVGIPGYPLQTPSGQTNIAADIGYPEHNIILIPIMINPAVLDSEQNPYTFNTIIKYLFENKFITKNAAEACDLTNSSMKPKITLDSLTIPIKSTTTSGIGTTKISSTVDSFPVNMQYTMFLKPFNMPIILRAGTKTEYTYENKYKISDIDPSIDNLNSGSNPLTNQTVYGTPMNTECKNLLDKMMTNSYIQANIGNYSKLSNIVDKSITNTPGGTLNSTFTVGDPNINPQWLITNTNNDLLFIDAVDGQLNRLNPADDTNAPGSTKHINQYYTSGANSSGVTNAQISNDCKTFYEGLCNYYYYYDYLDGIQYNPLLSAKINNLKASGQLSNFLPNLNYISQHIPDCRCANTSAVQDGSLRPSNITDSTIGAIDAIEYYYITQKCNAIKGKITSYGSYSDPSNTGTFATFTQSLYSFLSNSLSGVGFGAQYDPATATQSGMSDSIFMYAESARASTNEFNTYICNINQTISATNTGGNVIAANNSINCTFPDGGGNNGTSKDAVAPVKNQPQLNISITPPDGMTVNLSQYTEAVDPLYSLEATLIFPNPAYTFYNVGAGKVPYQFIYQPSDKKLQTIIGEYGCNPQGFAYPPISPPNQTCNNSESITLIAPFLYGRNTNEYGTNYNILITNIDDNSPNQITPSASTPIMLKQFAMQITNIIPGKDTSITPTNYYLQFNIQFNCISRPIIPYAVVLTPKDNSLPITLYGTDFFQDVSNNKGSPYYSNSSQSVIPGIPYNNINLSSADGTLTVVTPSAILYEYKILLNPSGNDISFTNGIIMNKSSNITYNDQFDFSNLQSRFDNTTISYLDYNNNNHVTLFPSSNPTANFGTSIVLNWTFINNDNYKYFNIYYTIGTNPPVLINNPGSISISITTYTFLMPVTVNGQKVSFNITATGSAEQDISSTSLTITSTPAPSTFNGWDILSNVAIKTPTPVNLNSIYIDNYLNPMTAITELPNYNAVSYDYTTNTWSKGTISDQSNDTTAFANGVVFQLPAENKISILSLTDKNNNPISDTTQILNGSLINITWQLESKLTASTHAQIYLYGIVYGSFPIPAQQITGTYQFMFYDITGSFKNPTPNLYISVYNIYKSSIITLNISKQINAITETNGVVSNPGSTNPLVYINAPANSQTSIVEGSVINSVNLTLSNTLENVYYNVFNGYSMPLLINSYILGLKNVNFSQQLQLNITNSIMGQFTNTLYGKIRKNNKEHFGNIQKNKLKNKLKEGFSETELNTNVFRIDLSQSSGYSKSVSIDYIFNNFSKVSIQSLELYFGTTNIDNSIFNISFTGSLNPPASNININDTTPIDIEIGSVRVIGIMTSQIFVPVNIPGANTIYYSTNTIGSNGWANSFALINTNNGYYLINPIDKAAVAAANQLALYPPQPSSNITKSNTQPASEDRNWLIWFLIILVIIIILVFVYFRFFYKPKNNSNLNI